MCVGGVNFLWRGARSGKRWILEFGEAERGGHREGNKGCACDLRSPRLHQKHFDIGANQRSQTTSRLLAHKTITRSPEPALIYISHAMAKKKKGKASKKDDDKRAERKARQAEKMAKKQEKKANKAKKKAKKGKGGKGGKDDGYDVEDLEAILAEFEVKEAAKVAVDVSPCPPIGARSASSIVCVPSTGDFYVYGGELYDGRTTNVYNELYTYNPSKEVEVESASQPGGAGGDDVGEGAGGEGGVVAAAADAAADAAVTSEPRTEVGAWTSISSPNSPPPRCGHQAVAVKDHMYIFGGEFTAASGLDFHHYRDLWCLELKTKKWEKIVTKTGPSPRSGHRMVVWKNCILLFGGFYEAYKDTRYFNDLWLFDMRERKWHKLESSKGKGGAGGGSGSGGGGGGSVGTSWPSQRGGMCFFAPAGANPRNVFFLYGGYSLASGKKSAKGMFHTDLWQLRLTPGGSGKVSGVLPLRLLAICNL